MFFIVLTYPVIEDTTKIFNNIRHLCDFFAALFKLCRHCVASCNMGADLKHEQIKCYYASVTTRTVIGILPGHILLCGPVKLEPVKHASRHEKNILITSPSRSVVQVTSYRTDLELG